MTAPRAVSAAHESLIALGDPAEWTDHDRATFLVAQRVLVDHEAKAQRKRERAEAAASERRARAVPKRKRAGDPPALVRGKRLVAARSGGRCEIGLPGCTGAHEHTHHRRRRSQGGSHDPENLLAMCHACHDAVHAEPERSFAEGWLLHASPLAEVVDRRREGDTK